MLFQKIEKNLTNTKQFCKLNETTRNQKCKKKKTIQVTQNRNPTKLKKHKNQDFDNKKIKKKPKNIAIK